MGVDCSWTGDVPMDVVAKVVGVLMGCPKSFDPVYGWVNVEGVKTMPTSVDTLGEILVTLPEGALRDWDTNGTGVRRLYWHHECGKGGQRRLSAKAAACNVALVRALGRVFGGVVCLSDTGTVADETYPVPGVDVWAEDGPGWYQVQAIIAGVVPVAQGEIEAARTWAAY